MKKPAPPKEEPVQKAAAAPVEPEKTEKKRHLLLKEKAETPAPVEEKKPKSNIDLHIVGKIDLDTISKETKPAKKEEQKEKPEGT